MENLKNLANLRKVLSLNQRDMALKLNIAKSTYAHYESGRCEPNIETLLKLADFFGCSVDYLLGHQTKSILYLDSFTDAQKEAIELIKTLNEKEIARVIGYIDGIKTKI